MLGRPKQNNIDDILRGLLGKIKRFLIYAGVVGVAGVAGAGAGAG